MRLRGSFSELGESYLVVLLVEDRLDAFFGCADAFGFVFDHGAAWVGLVDARSAFVHTCNQQGNSVGPGHWFFLGGGISFSEVEGKIGDGLGECLDSNGLEVGISMVQCLNATVFDQCPRIGDDSTCGTADMRVDLEDLLDGLRHDKCGVESPLNGEDNPLSTLDSNGR